LSCAFASKTSFRSLSQKSLSDQLGALKGGFPHSTAAIGMSNINRRDDAFN